MVARSCVNLLELVSGDILNFPDTPRAPPRVMSVPGTLPAADGSKKNDDYIYASSPACHGKTIIVANVLPLNAQKDKLSGRWCFSYDEGSLFLQLKDGPLSDTEVVYVGTLKVDVDANEQEEVSQKLLEDFSCVPTFLGPDLQKQFYHGFCKQYLWPLFHYVLPMYPDYSKRFDRSLWQAYVSANKKFADKVMEVINPDHLMYQN